MESRKDSAIAHTARGSSRSNTEPSGAPRPINKSNNRPLTHRLWKPEGRNKPNRDAVAEEMREKQSDKDCCESQFQLLKPGDCETLRRSHLHFKAQTEMFHNHTVKSEHRK